VLDVYYHLAKFGGARISPAAGAAKKVGFFCLSVCHAFERQVFVCMILPEDVGVQKQF